MTVPFPAAYRELMVERKASELAFYQQALANGELTTVPGKEHTTRKCKCDICLTWQEPGIRKFWHSGKSGGYWWVLICNQCHSELKPSAVLHEPTIASISQPVTTS